MKREKKGLKGREKVERFYLFLIFFYFSFVFFFIFVRESLGKAVKEVTSRCCCGIVESRNNKMIIIIKK